MPRFTRFIVLLVVVGVMLNLGIVLVANYTTEAKHERMMAVEMANFEKVINRLSGRQRMSDMVVEWQKIDTNGVVLETSLLFRRFTMGRDGLVALPTARIVIPGNKVLVDGITFDFDEKFSERYKPLRNKRLFFFGHVYGDTQTKEQQFAFFTPGVPPTASQVHPDRPTHLELRLWQHVGELMTSRAKVGHGGLHYTWSRSAPQTVQLGRLYKVYLGDDGVNITVQDDRLTVNEVLESAAAPN